MVGASACGRGGDDSANADACDREPAVVLGAGQFTHTALAEGDRVEMTFGEQGGWHVWTSASVTGMGPSLLALSTLTVNRTGLVVAGADGVPWPVDASLAGDGTWDPKTCTGTFFGQFTYLDDAVPPAGEGMIDVICRLDAEALQFSIEVSDADGDATATATLPIRPILDPANVSYCAAQ